MSAFRLVTETLQRLFAVRALIDAVASEDFPHDDSKRALQLVKDAIDECIDTLENQISPDSDEDSIRTFCNEASEVVSRFHPVIGLIARSADPIGAQELHWPFRQITRKALNSDTATLVVSSDWGYSPFTFILNEVAFYDIVFVGMPVAEANNALIAPLAGHELGHNIWRKRSVYPQLQPTLLAAVEKSLQSDVYVKSKESLGSEVEVQSYVQFLTERQCEELYCDIVGLFIFRSSYLHAFRFLLAAERELYRVQEYPKLEFRAATLARFAKELDIAVPENFKDSFRCDTANIDYAQLQVISELADRAVAECTDKIFQLVKEMALQENLCESTEEGVEQVFRQFENCEPARDAKCLQDIINAAWKFHLARADDMDPDLKNPAGLVSELAFKSCEVFQIEQVERAPQ